MYFGWPTEVHLSVIVLGELLAGFAAGTQEPRNRRELAAFMDSPRVSVLPITPATATYYATVFAQLRRKGRPIPTNDLWLAATAMEHGAMLLTHDRHFDEVDGLLVVRQIGGYAAVGDAARRTAPAHDLVVGGRDRPRLTTWCSSDVGRSGR